MVDRTTHVDLVAPWPGVHFKVKGKGYIFRKKWPAEVSGVKLSCFSCLMYRTIVCRLVSLLWFRGGDPSSDVYEIETENGNYTGMIS